MAAEVQSHMASGTGIIPASNNESGLISTGITDSSFRPIINVTPYSELNVNCWLATAIQHDGTEWTFRVKRSIGNGSDLAEVMSFMWKVIAVNPVNEVGPTVTLVSE